MIDRSRLRRIVLAIKQYQPFGVARLAQGFRDEVLGVAVLGEDDGLFRGTDLPQLREATFNGLPEFQ